MDRSEKLIEYGDSWFSPKCIEVQPQSVRLQGVKHGIGEGAALPTERNETQNTCRSGLGVRLRVRRSVVERETAQPDS